MDRCAVIYRKNMKRTFAGIFDEDCANWEKKFALCINLMN